MYFFIYIYIYNNLKYLSIIRYKNKYYNTLNCNILYIIKKLNNYNNWKNKLENISIYRFEKDISKKIPIDGLHQMESYLFFYNFGMWNVK